VPAQTPALQADPLVAERGQVRGGPPLAQRFTLHNHGTNAVAISEVQPSCGCLNPVLSARDIKPGESATLDLTVGTISQPDGPNTWSAKLTYRAGNAEQRLELQVKATLTREVMLEPSVIRLSGAPGLAHYITLTDHRDTPFDIFAVRTSTNHIAAEAGAWQRECDHWVRKIRVQLTADCPDRACDERLTIYSNDPDYRELTVPVTAQRHDRQHYLITPAEARFEVIGGTPTASVLVLIRDHDGRPVEIEKAECDDPAITCRFAEGAHATAAARLSVAKDAVPRTTSSLKVHIRTPAAETVTVPVQVNFKK
jgi:hypothetical protein